MPISVKCPACGREYRLKDHLAGKQFRCKDCDEVLTAPQPDARGDDEPWADPPGGHDEVYDPDDRPGRRRSKPRRPRRDMPLGVIVSTVINSLTAAINLLAFGLQLLLLSPCCCINAGFGVLHGFIAYGLYEGHTVARWASIVMSGIGLAFVALAAVGFIVVLNDPQHLNNLPPEVQNSPWPAVVGFTLLGLGLLIHAANIVCLVLPAAAEYFD